MILQHQIIHCNKQQVIGPFHTERKATTVKHHPSVTQVWLTLVSMILFISSIKNQMSSVTVTADWVPYPLERQLQVASDVSYGPLTPVVSINR